MVDWKAPDTQLFSGHVAASLTAISTGIYLWEFVISLDFDWLYLSRRSAFRWTLIPYFVARYLCAATFVLSIYGDNVFRPVAHCKLWAQFSYAGAHLAIAAATFLLVIRVIAVSERQRWVTIFLGSFWLVECGALVYAFVEIDGQYFAPLLACAPMDTVQSRLNMIISFSINFVCLTLVLFLLRQSRGKGLWDLLFSQGVTHFAVVVVAYIPPMVLLLLNLNDGVNLSLQCPALAALVICATRMYRALARFNEAGKDAFTMTSARVCWNGDTDLAAKSIRGRVRTIVIPRALDSPSESQDAGKADEGAEGVGAVV